MAKLNYSLDSLYINFENKFKRYLLPNWLHLLRNQQQQQLLFSSKRNSDNNSSKSNNQDDNDIISRSIEMETDSGTMVDPVAILSQLSSSSLSSNKNPTGSKFVSIPNHNEMVRYERTKSLLDRAYNIDVLKKVGKPGCPPMKKLTDCSGNPISPTSVTLGKSSSAFEGNGNSKLAMKASKGQSKYMIIAALSGTIAVAVDIYVKRKWRMHDYGVLRSDDEFVKPTPEIKETFRNANWSHLMHSAIIMAIPLTAKRPTLTFTLLSSGMIGFSGANYYMTFYGKNKNLMEIAWIGGILLMLSWFSFAL